MKIKVLSVQKDIVHIIHRSVWKEKIKHCNIEYFKTFILYDITKRFGPFTHIGSGSCLNYRTRLYITWDDFIYNILTTKTVGHLPANYSIV